MIQRFYLFVTAALITALSHTTTAQQGVVGRVVDTIGQPLPGVTVTMMPAAGGEQRRTTTAGEGTYRFDSLADAMYRVDFELRGFDVTRRSFVRVPRGASTFADATLRLSAICECVSVTGLPRVAQRSGRVVDETGRPLPRARLEIAVPIPAEAGVAPASTWREVRYADTEGRFSVLAPVAGAWALTASDSGFRPVTQQVSGSATEPLVFTLFFTGIGPPTEYERFSQGCRCSGDLFTHQGR